MRRFTAYIEESEHIKRVITGEIDFHDDPPAPGDDLVEVFYREWIALGGTRETVSGRTIQSLRRLTWTPPAPKVDVKALRRKIEREIEQIDGRCKCLCCNSRRIVMLLETEGLLPKEDKP